jgi:hypothetical protein
MWTTRRAPGRRGPARPVEARRRRIGAARWPPACCRTRYGTRPIRCPRRRPPGSAPTARAGDGGPSSGALESGPANDHPTAVDDTPALSARRDMFLDERGAALRVTWHPERDLVVMSVWHHDRCVGTFRMPVQDVPRLSGLLAAALGDWVDQAEGGSPRPPEGGGPDGPSGGGSGAPGGGGPGAPRGGGPGAPGGGGRGAPSGGGSGGGWGTPEGGGGGGLSVQQRLRLSRPVLRLRGLQHRRRRPPPAQHGRGS